MDNNLLTTNLMPNNMKTYIVNKNGIKTFFIFYNENKYKLEDYEKKNSKEMEKLKNILNRFFLRDEVNIKSPDVSTRTLNNMGSGNFSPKRMLVVCTQNSKSCTKDHFQHMIKTILLEDKYFKKFDIHLIDKADATSTSNSSSFSCARKIFGDKPFNCRTRIYSNSNIKSVEYKENTGKVIEGSTYIKSIPVIENPGSNYAYVQKCQKRIINIGPEGVGGILFDILLKSNKTGKSQRFVICNSNLSLDESDNILERLTDADMNINKDNKLVYDLEIIMATPEEYINKKFGVNNNKTNVFSNIRNKLVNKSERKTVVTIQKSRNLTGKKGYENYNLHLD